MKKSCGFCLPTISHVAFFSLEDETAAHEEQEETLLVGMKRPMDSESCGHYVR